ncbi:MAG: efflux RND transporter periplasmic adaptor subunit [Beijerinckiaceae bacterium]
MRFDKKTSRVGAAVAVCALIVAAFAYFSGMVGGQPKLGVATASAEVEEKNSAQSATAGRPAATVAEPESVDLTDTQRNSVNVEPVGEHLFPIEKVAVGSIDFNEDMSVQVFTPYQGKIISAFGQIGDFVKKGQTLFTIDSPDLLQAESTLIAAAGVMELTTRALARLKLLYETRAVAQKDLEQGISDQQTAEGALRAARDALRVFGKTQADIDQIVAERKADPTLVVPSPIDGRITARTAAPGLLVQPGSAPAPYVVNDISTMWMLANIVESDIPNFRVGQDVRVKVTAYPERVFEGKISTIGSLVDPNTHRVLVRSEIADPEHLLLFNMYANFVIRTGEPVRAVAVPLNGIVREGDGTMSAWVTTDRHHFVKRTVEIGLQRDGYDEILKGLKPGELIATDGAIFLSNMLYLTLR